MKTVSLVEALRSGKRFRIIQNGMPQGDWIDVKNYDESKFSVNEILYTECELKPSPREIWVGEYSESGILHYYAHENKERALDLCPTLKPIRFREVIE